MDYLTQRRQTLVRNLKKDGVDAILVTNPVNVTYLTGFTGDSSYLVATAKQFVLVSDSRFEEQIKEEVHGIDVHVRPHDATTVDAAAEVLNQVGAKAIGLEADHATLGLVEALQAKGSKMTFAPLKGKVEALRAVKDPAEIEQIRAAVRAAERAFQMFLFLNHTATTEKDMA